MGQLFREQNLDTTRVNYFTQPLTVESLSKLIAKTGLRPFNLLRKGEAVFKELKLSNETPETEIIEAMVNHPNLLQRPIVEVGERAVLARPIEKALELIIG